MKHNMFREFALIVVAALALAACGKNPAAPEITLTEVGHENTHVAVAGDEMHLEADIEAEGLVKMISLHINDEEHNSYRLDTVFADGKYVGVRNVEFHEHIDIPASCTPGRYKLRLAVLDQEGQTTEASDYFNVVIQ